MKLKSYLGALKNVCVNSYKCIHMNRNISMKFVFLSICQFLFGLFNIEVNISLFVVSFFFLLFSLCVCLVWFCFFVEWHINLCRLFNANAILLEEQQWYYLTHSWEDKGVHTFPKGICPKVNVIARLEYELAYYDSIALTITPRGHSFVFVCVCVCAILWIQVLNDNYCYLKK